MNPIEKEAQEREVRKKEVICQMAASICSGLYRTASDDAELYDAMFAATKLWELYAEQN